MAVSTKNIVAYPKKCAEINCNSCDSEDCLLCKPCMDIDIKNQLINAYREYIDRHDCKRVFPPTFVSIFVFFLYISINFNCLFYN